MSRRPRRTGLAFLIILGMGGAGVFIQWKYIQKHLPLVEAERAAAEEEGFGLLNSIPLPPGASPIDAGLKTFGTGSRNDKWHGVEISINWRREWDAPGDPDSIDAWFDEKLLESGWRRFERGIPSSVQKHFWREKWLLTVQRTGDFSTDRPPHARFGLLLNWDYRNSLGD